MIMRIMRDLCTRTPTWTPLSQWVSVVAFTYKCWTISIVFIVNLTQPGSGTGHREDHLVGRHAAQPRRLYAPRDGGTLDRPPDQRPWRPGSMREGAARRAGRPRQAATRRPDRVRSDVLAADCVPPDPYGTCFEVMWINTVLINFKN